MEPVIPDDVKEIVNLDFDPKTDEKFNSWSNKDNIDSYNNQPLGTLEKFTTSSNIADNKDIRVIYNKFIRSSNSVLELGAGYGRVLTELIICGYQGKLSCVERDYKFCNILRKNFSGIVNIHCTDILTLDLNEKFDLILWMWSGFAEFSQKEQSLVLQHITNFLENGGYLIIDTIFFTNDNLESALLEHHYIKTKYGVKYRYFPSYETICGYLNNLKLKMECIVKYSETLTKKEKCLYILKKRY